jgi:predicted house-cleaning NTP pyrophosphatase (Maf/HAM1 superfamily)
VREGLVSSDEVMVDFDAAVLADYVASGAAVEVHPADVDERVQEGEAPEAYVARIARSKAIAIART